MKLLITGGCGFLGSNLAEHALGNGIELYIFDSLYRNGSLLNLEWLRNKGEFEFVHGDIRNYNDVYSLVKRIKPDMVFHLAGQVAMTTSITNPRMDFEINVIGTHNLLEAIRLESPETGVIYSSTNKVYGDLEQFTYEETETRYKCIEAPNGFDEQTPLDFHSPYGCSKGAADQYMLDYARIYGLKTAVFRHSSMYGGRQFATYDQGWVGWFCQKAFELEQGKQLEPFTISGSGKQVRDVLHAEDMIRLYFSAVTKIKNIAGNEFNIGGGVDNSLSLLELFNQLEMIIDKEMFYKRIAERESDQKVFVADIAKASEMIGWVPKVSSEDGVRNMFDWVRNNQG
ncbi:GDP-mannose 4,6-dehydratase [Endozoicomonas sp. ONNA2]|uniref:GDP-mannose 4,6-dehydratase n=1 Tax=Endozoicomonas sp. ONNA2 TaxID=2828741 RepID=UPI00214799A9|nr:GDP-mannose 4,6-dehydratase [Endozoicomonas sp. ONNA2]